MTIGKAIEIMEDSDGLGLRYDSDQLHEAEKLGVEALKAWKEDREGLEPGEYELLPGETKE